MAKIKLPSFIQVSSGRVGDVVFYERKGVQCMRSYVIPVNPDTEGQRVCRGSFRDAVKSWRILPQEEKNLYMKKVDELNLNMNGYNLYISEYMKGNKTGTE